MKTNLPRRPRRLPVCLLTILLFAAAPAQARPPGDFAYRIVSESEVEITAYIGEDVGEVSIPGTIEGLPVTRIGPGAFEGFSGIDSVFLPPALRSIGNGAFSRCGGLVSVAIPPDVEDIGDRAFAKCGGLRSAVFRGNAPKMGKDVFHGTSAGFSVRYMEGGFGYTTPTWHGYPCQVIPRSIFDYKVAGGTHITITRCPKDQSGDLSVPAAIEGLPVTKIHRFAFSGCCRLLSVTLPEGLEEIGDWAFAGCAVLESVSLPASLKTLGEGAFLSCGRLQSFSLAEPNPDFQVLDGVLFDETLTLLAAFPQGRGGVYSVPAGVTAIGAHAFQGCALSRVNLPDELTEIGPRAFKNCASLTAPSLPSGLRVIGTRAFHRCPNLASIRIPAKVESIGQGAFASCPRLETIEVSRLNARFSSVDGMLFDHAGTGLLQCPAAKSGKYAVPKGVVRIGPDAFEGCRGLEKIALPDTLSEIGERAFRNCSALASVSVPKHVAEIARDTFSGCESLASASLPEGLTSIGASVFLGCRSLESLEIPDGVTFIGNSAFSGCESLRSLTLPEGVASIRNMAFSNCKNLESIKIPDSVTHIGNMAFWCCENLKSLVIPDSLSFIGSSAFSGCERLESVNIPDSVTSIGQAAFCGCESLESVKIPDGVRAIESRTFSDCKSLEALRIPASVETIENGPFPYCLKLKRVEVSPDNPDYASRNGLLLDKAGKTLIQCPAGISGTLAIPEGIVTIARNALAGCSRLASVKIPESVGTIEMEAFSGCSGLNSLSIPASVESIGGHAFSGCGNLAAIKVSPANPAFSSRDGLFLDKTEKRLIQCPAGIAGALALPEGLQAIGPGAFTHCSGLTSVKFPDSLETIDAFAFYACPGLSSVNIPAGVVQIGDIAFYECGVTAIHVDAANPDYRSIDGVLFDKSGTELLQWPPGKTGAAQIPDGVERIGPYAFAGCAGLSRLSLPSGLRELGEGACWRCTALTSVAFPSTLERLGQRAFAYCPALETACFSGNAPILCPGRISGSAVPSPGMDFFLDHPSGTFLGTAPDFTVYFMRGAAGFSTPEWDGHPSVAIDGAAHPAACWLLSFGLDYQTPLSEDPNHDGVDLLAAWALGLDPRRNLAGSMPRPELTDTSLSISFRADNPQVTYTVETSTDLEHWTSSGVTLSGPPENLVATVPRDGPRRFLRLKISH
jgi:hypothetical protein